MATPSKEITKTGLVWNYYGPLMTLTGEDATDLLYLTKVRIEFTSMRNGQAAIDFWDDEGAALSSARGDTGYVTPSGDNAHWHINKNDFRDVYGARKFIVFGERPEYEVCDGDEYTVTCTAHYLIETDTLEDDVAGIHNRLEAITKDLSALRGEISLAMAIGDESLNATIAKLKIDTAKNTAMNAKQAEAINEGEHIDYQEILNHLNGIFALLASGYTSSDVSEKGRTYGLTTYGEG